MFHVFYFIYFHLSAFHRIWGSRTSFTNEPSSSASTNCVNGQPKNRNRWRRPTAMWSRLLVVTPAWRRRHRTAWSSPVSSHWNDATSATNSCADYSTKDSSVTVRFFLSCLQFLHTLQSIHIFFFPYCYCSLRADCPSHLLRHRPAGLPSRIARAGPSAPQPDRFVKYAASSDI